MITPAQNPTNVIAYSIYLAKDAQKRTLLGRVAASGSKAVTFKLHAAYKAGQHLLVVSSYSDLDMEEGVWMNWLATLFHPFSFLLVLWLFIAKKYRTHTYPHNSTHIPLEALEYLLLSQAAKEPRCGDPGRRFRGGLQRRLQLVRLGRLRQPRRSWSRSAQPPPEPLTALGATGKPREPRWEPAGSETTAGVLAGTQTKHQRLPTALERWSVRIPAGAHFRIDWRLWPIFFGGRVWQDMGPGFPLFLC